MAEHPNIPKLWEIITKLRQDVHILQHARPPGFTAITSELSATEIRDFIEAGLATTLPGALISPSGDSSGVTDRTALRAAVEASLATGGGEIRVSAGTFYLDERVEIPGSVNLWGAGSGEGHAGTEFIVVPGGGVDGAAVTYDGGIAFGNRDIGGRGGMSGNFTVNGAEVGVEPLFVGLTVQRTFVAMESTNSAGVGLTVEGAQNCQFLGCSVSHAATDGVVLDYSAAGNRFRGLEIDSSGDWALIVRQSGPAPAGLYSIPFDNSFIGGIFERESAAGSVKLETGDLTLLSSVQLVHTENDPTFEFIRLEAGSCILENVYCAGHYAGSGTGLRVLTDGIVFAEGVNHFVGPGTVLHNDGTVYQLGMFRNLSTTTELVGFAPILQQDAGLDYGQAILGTIPVVAAVYHTLGTVHPTPINGAWWRLDIDSWPTPPAGKSLQVRLVTTAIDMTPGHVLGTQLVAASAGFAGVGGEGTAIADSFGSAQAVTDWIAMPASATGWVAARNQTAVSGAAVSAFIEVRIA
jgi:hypothetical protein